MFGPNPRTACIRIFRAKHVPAFRWEADVLGVYCTKPRTFKSVKSATVSAVRWCKRVGLEIYMMPEDVDD